jgi:PRTRC genetic system protein B
MNTYVNIGSSQDFRLTRALLIYGKSSYDSIPYRHPFVTLHEVIHDGDSARLGEGQLATPQMLADLMVQLGRSVPVEILPERVLVRTPEVMVWWTPACERTMFFSVGGGDPSLRVLNAKRYPHPPLIFKSCGVRLWVRALSENRRPSAATQLYAAPYWNCYDDGNICTGSMKVPRERSIQAIDSWEQSFFQSEFTHVVGNRKRTGFPGGLLPLWKAIAGRKRFPSRYLIRANQTLDAFLSNHDHNSRNDHRAG